MKSSKNRNGNGLKRLDRLRCRSDQTQINFTLGGNPQPQPTGQFYGVSPKIISRSVQNKMQLQEWVYGGDATLYEITLYTCYTCLSVSTIF